jgi:hypothetical protein
MPRSLQRFNPQAFAAARRICPAYKTLEVEVGLGERARTFRTLDTCHSPPRAVRTPRPPSFPIAADTFHFLPERTNPNCHLTFCF